MAYQSASNFKAGQVYAYLALSWPVLLGLAAATLPTWKYITTQSWPSEQGSHSPLVLAAGLWLLAKLLPGTKEAQRRPDAFRATLAVGSTALAMVFFRAAAVIELEVYALYALFVAVLYAFIGQKALQRLWFPLFFLVFAVPLPETLVTALTTPLKLWISDTAVSILYFGGYPIASSGVTIQIGQYQLLVAAACAGLNSLITLTALTLFYVYVSHSNERGYIALLTAFAIPVAIFSNLVRVLILVLLTYHGGEAAAAGFLHNFAGLTTFAIALVTIYLLDQALSGARKWFGKAHPTT